MEDHTCYSQIQFKIWMKEKYLRRSTSTMHHLTKQPGPLMVLLNGLVASIIISTHNGCLD